MMIDVNTWNDTKPIGDIAERRVAAWLTGHGYTVEQTSGYADHDLWVSSRWEIKHDRRAERSDNVAIEIAYRGQPSGIMTTGATHWAIVVGDTAYLARGQTIRALIQGRPEVRAGDGRRAVCRLLPLDVLRQAKGVHIVDLRGVS